MIDLKEIYDNLSEKQKGRFSDYYKYAYQRAPNAFGNEIERQTDIDRFGGNLGDYSDKHDGNTPMVVITSVKLEDEVPTKLKIKVFGKYSNKEYQRTVYTPGGGLEVDVLEEKVQELVEQIDPIEKGAKLTQKGADELQDEAVQLLSEAFGSENVGGQHSNKPVKVHFKKDGSVRLQITDLSAEAMMEIANLASNKDLDLDLS